MNTGAAMRLVYTIGLVKWIALALILAGVLVVTMLGISTQSSVGGGLAILAWLYGLAAALGVYVLLGWLQQTLLMLVGIAKNTAQGSELDILSRF